jgi:hypothetical protein
VALGDVIEGLHERFGAAGEIAVLLDHEPRAVATSPLLYSLLDNAQRRADGTIVVWTYRIRSTLCLSWSDPQAAEASVQAFSDSLPAAVDAAPRLGGAARDAFVQEVDAGWREFNGVLFRVVDLYTVVTVFAPLGA